ncbi:MAG: 3-oxoacyl-[acyl-carrier-protein] reductase [Hyphomonas sp.]|uniref:3-oxoacyl-[acyl-carrier-protein] reductase n=1 Tax=Hyphomonas sp. TaxID=87 RepID=UPI00179A7791|nr:3-oxoacyl-[acyl-carrier-protein] reductase [Hyphomonas sp.]MBA3070017.1 3-oxoacyl-[acyl-carrier-protein] reductase [Hyphomonas sp.]MBU3921006.1 3-oxoacyl-[acyl-carrier-protein] reductase [Alphaproteobacteria bacterium]MBU4060407.1 3-oxoacyl-[acyl-carrier-protein] reductase [Alphaproteobacteria bacterium]MBU4163075.1 3-oxoacyl-[acyl-carrier-protein] reductase [Alphaproteobacteria bacterium]
MFDLTGRTALVTGASGGIGRSIAQALSAAGARVALSGTREAVLQEVAATLKGESAIVPCNLSDPAAVDALVSQAEAAIGPLDILVANAGITRDKLLIQMKDEDWNEVINVNLGSYFRLAKTAVRGMMKRRHGRVIGITSIVGVTGNPGQANYCASKAGMIGFTKALAQEVASRGITANTIAPGFIESPMTDGLPETQKQALLGQIPSGRLGQGNDIAAGAVYLASAEAAYVTGQTLHINGGMAMI